MRINIPRQQVKNDQALDFLLPESVSKRVMQYIDDWRPFLTHQQTPISSLGVMANLKTALRFTIRLKTRFGKRQASGLPHINSGMQPLRFYLMPKPGHYEVVRKVLGHKSLTTTYSHYAGAETQAAISLYDDVIIQHRQKKAFADAEDVSVAEPPFMDPLQLYGGKR